MLLLLFVLIIFSSSFIVLWTVQTWYDYWFSIESSCRITLDEEKIVIFDTGRGMDGSDANSISKW